MSLASVGLLRAVPANQSWLLWLLLVLRLWLSWLTRCLLLL